MSHLKLVWGEGIRWWDLSAMPHDPPADGPRWHTQSHCTERQYVAGGPGNNAQVCVPCHRAAAKPPGLEGRAVANDAAFSPDIVPEPAPEPAPASDYTWLDVTDQLNAPKESDHDQ